MQYAVLGPVPDTETNQVSTLPAESLKFRKKAKLAVQKLKSDA